MPVSRSPRAVHGESNDDGAPPELIFKANQQVRWLHAEIIDHRAGALDPPPRGTAAGQVGVLARSDKGIE
jgi:hypothetical protein